MDLASLLTAAVVWSGTAAGVAKPDIAITQTSIEELLSIKITSASKRPERISSVPAAIYVLTAEDIRRSGATSIPEALRLVPGAQVARIDANKWAVSIRGFNSRTANKLLVMIDGRSIYDPLFTGVLWETKDVMLEDVERIEVIRGPGGTLWGANAVNGVINIITRPAGETRGALVTAGAGTEVRAIAGARYGFDLGEGHYLRVYGKFTERDEGYLQGGADDDSRLSQGGFRYDGELKGGDTLMFEANAYDGKQGTADLTVREASNTSGSNLLGRWKHDLRDGGRMSLLAYYDHTRLETPVLGEVRDTYSLEYEHHLARAGRHLIAWGAGFRHSKDEIDNTPQLALQPERLTQDIENAYIQDEITLKPGRAHLTLGAKVESNDFTGSEILPNVRLAWQVNESDILWAAVSEAVRTPSRLEEDFVIPLPGGGAFAGNESLEAEVLTAYEAGYRAAFSDKAFFDVAAFLNRYDDLVTTEGLTLGNRASGDVQGFEIVTTYIPSEPWKLVLGYSRLEMELELESGSLDDPAGLREVEQSNPEWQAFLQIGAALSGKTRLDVAVRHVDALPAQDVPAYTVADLRFSKTFGDALELSIVGRNLFDKRHFEQGTAMATQVERGAYAKLSYRF